MYMGPYILLAIYNSQSKKIYVYKNPKYYEKFQCKSIPPAASPSHSYQDPVWASALDPKICNRQIESKI